MPKRLRIRHLRYVSLVASMLILLGSLGSTEAFTFSVLNAESQVAVDSPEVILQNGTLGSSTIYTNSTSAMVSVEAPLFDFVDNNVPNVDSSADKGTHSNFSAQQTGPDSTIDTLEEENTEAVEDYVDNNVSDVDGSGDKGTLSDFDNMKTKDGMANLTEVAGGTPTDLQVSTTCMDQMWNQGQDWEWYSAWTPPGSGTVTVTKLWFWDGDGTVGSGETIYMAMYENGAGYSKLSGSDTTLTGTGSQGWLSADVSTSFEITLGTTYWIGATCASGDTYNICRDDGANCGNYPPNGIGTYYQTNNYVLDSSVPTGASQSSNKYIIPGITYTTGTGDYELDQEVQFTNIIDFLPTEKLCIYAGPLGDEDLRVDYWNGTGWDNLSTDLIAHSCNEYTVSLTSVNFTIRFKGGTESSDITQDQWQIAACLLRVEGAGSREDAVDQQSNVDSSTDVGTHSDFNAMKTKDGYDNLTESTIEQQYTFFEDWESGSISSQNWTTYSSVAQGRIVVDTDTPHEGSYALWMDVSATATYSLNELITNFNFSGATQVVLDFYHNEQGDENDAGSDHTDHQNADGVYYTLDGSYWYHLVDLVDPSGWTNVNINITADPDFQGPVNSSFAIKFTQYDNYPRTNDGRGFENINITYTISGTDYTMDLEVQWIDLPYLLPNENISIYCGTMGSEDLKVDVWNATDWETVFTGLSSGWNNASITDWLTTSSFTIRFKGGNETGDPSQDTWQIDVALIHLWHDGGETYQLDLEVQWTGAVFTRASEELCIRTGTFSGSENIQVKVWNSTGSFWHWVMNLTASQWNNASITSYLTSSTFTIQLSGGTENGDSTQDSWNIDATLLHVWTIVDTFNYIDNNTSDLDSSADKGTHGNFSAQQAGPDSIYDTLTEGGTSDVVVEDYVDQISNVDGVSDLGSHDVFADLQASDNTYDNITEAGSAAGISKLGIDTSGTGTTSPLQFSHTLVSGTNRKIIVYVGWENNGLITVTAATYGGEILTLAVEAYTATSGYLYNARIYYIDEADLPSDGSNQVSFTFTGASSCDITALCAEYGGIAQGAPDDTDESGEASPGDDTIENTGLTAVATDLLASVVGCGNVGSFSHGQSQNELIDFSGGSSTFSATDLICTGSVSQVDSTYATGANRLARAAAQWSEVEATDFQMDLELQFTDVMDFMAIEYVCIETGSFYGSEDINVTYWTGSVWSTLASDMTASTWNNYSVSLTSSNFTIKFGGSDTASDTVQDGWEIDSVLFQYSGAGSDEDFVDQTSNVDGIGDVGTHDVFADLQASDDSYDNMTEVTGGGGDYNTIVLSFSPDYRWELDGDETDSVDGADSDGGNDPSWVSNIIPNGATQCGDYDGSTDETLIPNQADINTAATYQKSISVWVDIDTIDTTARFIWGEGGSATALALYVFNNSGTDTLYYVISEDSGGTQDILTWTGVTTGVLYHILITMDTSAGTMYLYVNGSEVASKTGGLNIGSDLATHAAGVGIGGDDLALLIHTGSTASGQFDGRIADVVYYAEQTVLDEDDADEIYTAGVGGGDYQLELEVQFNIPDEADSMPIQRLCIETGTLGSEDILVQWWNGSSWKTLWSDLTASSWNNASIAGNLTGSTFTILFRDGTQSGDTITADSWFIDSVLIYLESGESNELDLEVQWTGAVFTRASEELCISTGTFSGSENIQVKVWNSTASSWDWVMNLTASQWNNVSITSYLTSSTFTIQFSGGTEMGDSTQDSWNIDATLLHVWTNGAAFDYVLRVNNTETESWQIRLKSYSDSNLSRLDDCTIYFYNSTGSTSNQIVVEDGSYSQSVGPWFNLGDSETVYIAMVTEASATGASSIYVCLEILKPGTTTYNQYILEFIIS